MKKAKNVIWIFGDQHRQQALSLYGDPNLSTPNIDNLARSGVDFPNARMGFPLCSPCRGSLLTGIYPHQCVPGHQYPMPDHCRTVAHAFGDHGYDTAWFGKWHVDGFDESKHRAAFHVVPPARRGGFSTWLGYDNNNSQYDCWVHGHEKDGKEVKPYQLPGYETDCLTDLLIDFLEKKAAEKESQPDKCSPFFASLSVQPPHWPYMAPAEFARGHNPADIKLRPNVPDIPSITEKARHELAGYYAMIENLDWNVGRVRDTLRELGMEEDTYIIFFSDHGDSHGSLGQFQKLSPFEESVKVPFIISGGVPFYDHQSGTRQALVNHVDVAPTSLGLCGLEKASWMQGTDLSSCYRKDRPKTANPASLYLQCVIPTRHGDSVDRPWRGIVTDDGWKFVCLEGQPWLLFNLAEDPYEQVNLAFNSKVGAKRKELLRQLAEWIEKTGDKFPLPEL